MAATVDPKRADNVADRLCEALGPGAERRETHGSWVVLTTDRAYKVKKPVVLDFLDYGTLDRRRAMCRAEIEVNRRGAPDLYLGVRAVVPSGGGVALAPEDDPRAIEYVVEMRRFDEQRTLAAALARGEAPAELIVAVGEHLARFHERCAPVPATDGAEPVERTLDDNFASLGTLLGEDAAAQQRLAGARRFAASFLAARRRELDGRARQGRVRDGHGDLRAEHVLLGRPLEVVDAIEFDPGLRQIDVGMDLSFLVMDLHAAGRADLAAELLRAYRSAGGDPGDDRLVAFFAAYRAQVRAKVALLRAAQAPGNSTPSQATELLALAERLSWRARGDLVIAVAGGAATGKTTLAAALSTASGLPHLSSDVARKRLLGLSATARAPETAYAPGMNEWTYRELGSAASRPGGAIVDATFRRRADRDAFREGLGSGISVVFVECRVPAGVVERRAAARLADASRISDATPAIARRQRREFEPLDEVPPGRHLTIRSDQDPAALVTQIADALGAGVP